MMAVGISRERGGL